MRLQPTPLTSRPWSRNRGGLGRRSQLSFHLCWKPFDQLIAYEAGVVASAGENPRNVGAAEIVPLEEERLTADLREGVGKAVAVVQAGAMPSLAIHAVGDTCGVRLAG